MAVDTSLRIMFMQDLGTLAISWRPIFHLHTSTQENACIFFSWDCKLVLLSTILFPISYFPLFSWCQSIWLSGVGLCVHEFAYLVPQYCWLEAHESINIFTTPLFRLHHTHQTGVFGKELGTLHPSQPTELHPLAQADARKPHTQHAQPISS